MRVSESDRELVEELRRLGLKPTTFIREALREKIARDRPMLLIEEQKRKNLIILPF